MNCPNCHQPAAANAAFCGACGSRLEGATPNPSPSDAGASPSAVEGAPPPGIIDRIRNILVSPRNEWPVVAREGTTGAQLLQSYVLPLALFAAVVTLVHMSVIGISLPFGGRFRTPVVQGLMSAVMACVMGLIGVCIVAAIINMLAPRFNGTQDYRQALKTAAYSLTPAYLGGVFNLLPSLGPLLGFLAGCYGIYVLYLGLPVTMRSDRERAGTYTALVVVCTIVLGILLGVAGAAVGFGPGRMFTSMSAESDRDRAREEGAAAAASVIGGALGTDEKGKAGIATALSNLAKAGEQMEAQSRAAARSGDGSAASPDAAGSSSGTSDGSAGPSAAASDGSSASASSSSSSGGAASGDAANPVGAAGGLLTALGGALSGGRHVEPVDFHKLQDLLPASLPGMTRAHAEGAANEAMGVKGTSAKGTYRGNGDALVEIEIADASGVAGLMGLAGALGANEVRESDTGYEKNLTVRGHPAHEKYDSTSKHGEISVIVAQRFTVGVSGDRVPMEQLQQALGHVDLAALEGMKDAGAK